MLYWMDAPASSAWQRRLEQFRAELEEEGYAWLVAELDALLERQFGMPRRRRTGTGARGCARWSSCTAARSSGSTPWLRWPRCVPAPAAAPRCSRRVPIA
ncbi:hypothetical protein ACE0DR_00205 [Azotobacter sp. CWF10]